MISPADIAKDRETIPAKIEEMYRSIGENPSSQFAANPMVWCVVEQWKDRQRLKAEIAALQKQLAERNNRIKELTGAVYAIPRFRLLEWFEKNNPCGFDSSKPAPREMVSAAFPDEDDERLDYLTKKPCRVFELF